MLGLQGQAVAIASQQQQQQASVTQEQQGDMMSPSHSDANRIHSASPEAGEQQKSAATPAAAANNRRVSSPGYHSAASSPDSSVSSLVSSTASSSSGISSTGSDNHQQRRHNSPPSCPTASNALMMALTTSAGANKRAQFVGGTQTVSCTTANITSSTIQIRSQAAASQPPATRTNSNQAQAHGQQQQQPNLLDYYPEAQQDGANLSWFHAANSRQALSKALASKRSIVAGDISLAELSRYPVPIMARPPLGASDLTLENWLTEVIQARKGIKLTFTSTRTVEPAFRVLARHAEHLKGPIILSADVLTRPSSKKPTGAAGCSTGGNAKQQQQQQQQPVDAWTFLMLCRTRFPKSIISIGWCPQSAGGTNAQSSHQRPEISLNQPASEPMFELDMMLDICQPASNSAMHPKASLLNLMPSSGQLGSNANLSSIQMVQQLAAAAAAAAAAADNHNKQQQQPQQGGYSISSTGSLTNSSSGNSSGSPSPTSPIGHPHHLSINHSHHLHHHHHHSHNQRHLQMGHHQRTSSAEQLILAAAAAAAAANEFKQSNGKQQLASGWPARIKHEMIDEENADQPADHHHNRQHQQQRLDGTSEHDELDDSDDCHQLPLNLNINEADPQHGAASSSAAALQELAKQIKSFQQHTMSSFGELAVDPTNQTIGAHGINKRLFSAMSAADSLVNPTLLQQVDEQRKWEHVNKKPALGHRLNSSSPSPVAANSPKGNLLCVGQHQHHHQALRQQLAQQHEPAGANSVGYTREMIDKMASLVKEYNLTQPITFPVEARLLNTSSLGSGAQNSLGELQRLLYQVGTNSTLTVVAQPEDLISVEDLLTIRKHFATNQIMFDLPDQLAALLRHELELH